jgi:squalene-hopene/tetraprenyl-beta-curcumene cyclase
MIAFLAVFVLSLSPQAPSPSAPGAASPTAAQAAPAAKAPDLKNPVDEGVAWLRNSQDAKTGSYGGGVEGTAWVLRAMADCHRKYRRVDGPFVERALAYLAAQQAPDGSIHDAGADAKAVRRQTALAIMALQRHADAQSKAVLAKALAFAGTQQLELADADLALPASGEEAIRISNELLARRGADKAWDGPRGKVIETARVLCVFNAATPLMTPPAKPKPAQALPGFEAADREQALAALQRGAQYMLSQCLPEQPGIFGFGGKPNAGITAMALGALLEVPEPREAGLQAAIDRGLGWLVSLQQANGSIHDGQVANYTTSAAILALVRANRPEFAPVVAKAQRYLIELQNDEAEGFSPDHPFYGGNSYGNEQRPDLSNVQMALEALAASGLSKDHEAYQRALVFLQRCQNRSESNDVRMESGEGLIVSGDDGGSGYAPGDSKAGFLELPDGRKIPRSYGSMSYALLKGYIFCGVPKDDPRMVALMGWLSKNYTLDLNPGFQSTKDPTEAYQGLFYYFHTMGKALALYGSEEIVDGEGTRHPWRKQLCGRLVALQSKTDGSWVNQNSSRWYEGNPVLATSYAMLTLGQALPR